MSGEPYTTAFRQIEALKEVLTSGGRSLVQGCLAWNWAQSDRTIPIPGFRSEKQVRENAEAMQFGPLTTEQVADVNRIFDETQKEET